MHWISLPIFSHSLFLMVLYVLFTGNQRDRLVTSAYSKKKMSHRVMANGMCWISFVIGIYGALKVYDIVFSLVAIMWHNPNSIYSLLNHCIRGPLFICLSLALILSTKAPSKQTSHVFTTVFIVMWVGALIVTVNAQLLGASISIFQSLCVSHW